MIVSVISEMLESEQSRPPKCFLLWVDIKGGKGDFIGINYLLPQGIQPIHLGM